MKIYTKRGDQGRTGLIGSSDIAKGSLIFDALGDLDELNSSLGVMRAVSPEFQSSLLEQLQSSLFDVGAELASEPGGAHAYQAKASEMTSLLEESIDEMTSSLAPLTQFILPGGTVLAAHIHMARTICRRAERSVNRVSAQRTVRPEILSLLNRLSDWLFTAAREANRIEGFAEPTWKPT